MPSKWSNKDVPLGFTFHKFFPGFGWFKGEVVQIRMGARYNKTRRICYEDGDMEDLSLREIQRAVIAYKKHLSKTSQTEERVHTDRTSDHYFLSESMDVKETTSKRQRIESDTKDEADQTDRAISSIPPSFICLDNSDVESQITQDLPASRREFLSNENNPSFNSLASKGTIDSTPRKSNTSLKEDTEENIHTSTMPPSNIHINLSDESISNKGYDSESRTKRTKKIAKRKGLESKQKPHTDEYPDPNREHPQLHDASFGEVGFELYKFFPEYGWCKGMIIHVHSGTYANRRVAYDQGFEEELSLAELNELLRVHERYLRKTVVSDKNGNASQNIIGSDEKIGVHPVSASSAELNEAVVSSELDEFDNFVPLDPAAESTLQSNMKLDDDSTVFNENWLATVASRITNTRRGKNTTKTAKPLTLECNIISQDHSRPIHEHEMIVSEDILRPTLLTNIQRGKRYGCKVIDIHDPNRIVAQVLLEHSSGWLELNVGSGESKKGRISHYIAVPRSYNVGDVGPTIEIVKQESVSVQKIKDTAKKRDIGTADAKLSFHDVIYWFCGPCQTRIMFDSNVCPSCQRSKMEPSSITSVLLEIAENICIAHDNQETLPLLPALYRKCIPDEVLGRVQKALQGRKNEATHDSAFYYELDNLFYWQCNECTMTNSFRRWSCLACKKKRNEYSSLSPLLRLAFELAKDENHIESAIQNIPIEHECAIPGAIMKALVTCIEVAKKTKQRCRCPKVLGTDYCSSHQKSLNISTRIEPKEENNVPIENVDKGETCGPFISVEDVRADAKKALRRLFPKQSNPRDWQIKCIEDAFISERNEPFPLGMNVRRYFAGYGWHDGFIITVSRRDIIDNSEGISRPVLLYRVAYNDGDQEDLLHHEVNSLRQLYDIRTVRSTAAAHEQIKIGTQFETMIGRILIKGLQVDIHDARDKATVYVEIETPGEPPKQIFIELLKLERLVIKLITPYSRPRKKLSDWLLRDSDCSRDRVKLPFIEWPSSLQGNEPIKLSNSSICLHHSECDASDNDERDEKMSGKNTGSGYDPSGILKYVSYCPFESTYCQICKALSDDHYLLICDECDRGYHTYCLRPVVVNIPREIWLCPKCNPDNSTLSSYEDIFQDLMKNSEEVLSFLKSSIKSSDEYYSKHRDAFEILNCKNKWSETFGKKKSMVHQVGDFYVTRNKDRKDRYHFKLPEPIQDPILWTRSLASIAAAAKYCGMNDYTETLVYESDVPESMNDASLENVEGLNKVNLDLFQKYKSNLKVGIYPPVEVVYDMNIGFLVKALMKIPRHTIISEYIGAVNTITECRNSSSDSLMNLLLTGDDSTSLIIDPSRVGNMARFFSGINNKHYMSKKNANMRTRRFALDGKCRVVLFTCKDVMEGDILHYDYNAGVEGKSVDEMIQTGFYDTSNFL